MSVANPFTRGLFSETPLPQVAARAARQAIAAARRERRLSITRVVSKPKPLSFAETCARWAVMLVMIVTISAMVTVAMRSLLGSGASAVSSSSLAAKCLDLPSCLR